jgi:hypothetical protein
MTEIAIRNAASKATPWPYIRFPIKYTNTIHPISANTAKGLIM